MSDSTPWTAERLREALEQGVPVHVLDVRPADQRAEWSIPGSIHAPVARALIDGDTQPLEDAVRGLGKDRPVIAVCAMGRTSQLTLAPLSRLGFEAHSLMGGMQSWSGAWNQAEVALPPGSPSVTQVRRAGKGCLSYLVGSNGEAAVIDPSIAPADYEKLAKARGLRIVAVLETHVHADHVSRARELAKLTGATMYIPEQTRVKFPFHAVRDGDEIPVGGTRLRVIASPGHTFESVSYRIGDSAVATGDTLFVAGVGRPDLKAAALSETEERARLLYRSLTGGLFTLPESMVVLPCHAPGPIAFDGVPIAATLGAARAASGIGGASEAEFARSVVDHLPPNPPNHTVIVEINEGLEPVPEDLAPLEAGANRCALSQAH